MVNTVSVFGLGPDVGVQFRGELPAEAELYQSLDWQSTDSS